MPPTLVVAAYAIIAVLGNWHIWADGASTHAAEAGGDPAASMWFLSWAAFALLHGHNPLFSSYGNFPYGVNMLVNTATLPLGILVAPVTLLFGPVVSFNLLMTAAPAVSALAAYALVRRFTAWRPAAFAAGLVYGFSPYVVAEGVGHLMTVFVPLPPLILLLVSDLVTRPHGRPLLRGALLGLLLTVQFFISTEVLVGTVVIAAAGLGLAAVFRPRQVAERFRFVATALAAAAGVGVVLLAYPMWFVLAGPAHITGPVQPYPQLYRADLLGPVVPDRLQHFAPASLAAIADRFGGNASENGSYLGVPLVLVLIVGAVALWRVLVVRIAALLCAFAFVLSLGSRLVVDNHATGIKLPEAVFDKIPLLDNALPVRFSLYVVLCGAVVFGVVLDRLHATLGRRGPRAWSIAAPIVLAVVVVIPLLPAWPSPVQATSVPSFFTSDAVDAVAAGSVTLLYPFPDQLDNVPETWSASALLRFKMVGGRFNVPQPTTGKLASSYPSETDTVLSALAAGDPPSRSTPLRTQIQRQLRSWHVTTVIAAPPAGTTQSALSYLGWLLGARPVPSDGVYVWYGWR